MSAHSKNVPYYFVPSPSGWPVLMGLAMLATMFGAAGWVNDVPGASTLNAIGLLAVLTILYMWFGDARSESEGGQYNKKIDLSFRWSMSWFIFSEVMFFGAFFGALFYARAISMPWMADLDHKFLWPDFSASWPNMGPTHTVEAFQKMLPLWVPTINTALLLTSGLTITISHHMLRAGNRSQTAFWLFLTILLGATFLYFQATEYYHAYTVQNLRLTSGIYGSTFFLLTGFHGFHVTLGALMLTVVLVRILRGDFTPDHHFAFEGVSWYWHFVDVVWLGLYIVVYWL